MVSERKSRLVLFLSLVCYVKGQSISDSLNAFSIDLLTATSAEPGSPKNLAISPYTVWTLLSIIDEGARGDTAKQLERVLRIPDASNKDNFRDQFKNLSSSVLAKDPKTVLEIYNSIFTTIEHKLKPEYQSTVAKHYGVDVRPTDFTNKKLASSRINNFVAQATRNRITDFIHPEDLDYAQIFLVTTLYFKGAWTLPFDRSKTRRDSFYDEKQNKLGEVDMMYQMNFFPYARLDWIQGYSVEVPYGDGSEMAMILILPYKGQTLQGMLQQMTKQPFSRIMDKLAKVRVDYEGEDVQLFLPRFKAESDLTLNVVLQKMGVTDVFDDTKADLLKMFQHYLYITRLIQRAEIEVNEEGTVASAASGASVVNKIPPPKFQANKPFLYFIVNKPARSILFAGKLTVPPQLHT